MPVEEWRYLINFNRVLRSYIETALWASIDYDTESSLDSKYGPEDLAPETRTQMMSDIVKFLNSLDIEEIEEYITGDHSISGIGGRRITDEEGEFEPQTESNLGHDLFLTRNGHGVGFWDRNLGNIGERFTEAANALGEILLYVGDDGKIYQQDA